VIKAKLVSTVILSLIIGGIFANVPLTQSGAQDRIFLLIMIGATSGVRNVMESVRLFLESKALVNLEISSQMYSALPYFLSRTLAGLPIQALQVALSTAIVYPISGLQAGRWLTFGLALFATAFTAESLGTLLGAAISSEQVLSVVAPLVMFPIFLFSGPVSANVPSALEWVEYLVFFKYSVIILANNEYNGLSFSVANPAALEALDGMPNGTAATALSVTMSGEDFLAILGINDVSVTQAWIVLVTMGFALRVLGYYILWFRLHKKLA